MAKKPTNIEEPEADPAVALDSNMKPMAQLAKEIEGNEAAGSGYANPENAMEDGSAPTVVNALTPEEMTEVREFSKPPDTVEESLFKAFSRIEALEASQEKLSEAFGLLVTWAAGHVHIAAGATPSTAPPSP